MLREYKSLEEFAAYLGRVERKLPAARRRMLAGAGKICVRAAELKFGHYQPAIGPFPAWAPLQPATQERREWMGYPADEPLLMRGDFLNSCSYVVLADRMRFGSDDPVAEYHEWGTRFMPPRPVFGPALIESMPVILKLVAEETAWLFRSTL